MKAGNPILYPQISRLPGSGGISDSAAELRKDRVKTGEFDAILQDVKLKDAAKDLGGEIKPADLSKLREPLKMSAHAAQRLKERSINIDSDLMGRMNDAIDKADAKGLEETLVLTDKAAMIVSVPNRTIITAMDLNNLKGNLFTNIDGAVFV